MSAAIDRMADQAMERLRLDIGYMHIHHSASIALTADIMRINANGRYVRAIKDHRRAVIHRFVQGEAFRTLMANTTYAFGDLRRTAEDAAVASLRMLRQYEEAERIQRALSQAEEAHRMPMPVVLAGALALSLTLGWLGPRIDAEPDRRAEWLQAEEELQQQGALERWEAEARAQCAAADGGAYIQVEGGGIVCTDKRGRHVRRTPL